MSAYSIAVAPFVSLIMEFIREKLLKRNLAQAMTYARFCDTTTVFYVRGGQALTRYGRSNGAEFSGNAGA